MRIICGAKKCLHNKDYECLFVGDNKLLITPRGYCTEFLSQSEKVEREHITEQAENKAKRDVM